MNRDQAISLLLVVLGVGFITGVATYNFHEKERSNAEYEECVDNCQADDEDIFDSDNRIVVTAARCWEICK